MDRLVLWGSEHILSLLDIGNRILQNGADCFRGEAYIREGVRLFKVLGDPILNKNEKAEICGHQRRHQELPWDGYHYRYNKGGSISHTKVP